MKPESNEGVEAKTPGWIGMAMIASVGLNLILGAWWLRPAGHGHHLKEVLREPGPLSGARSAGLSSSEPSSPPPPTSKRATPWSRMASTNFLEFAARLRDAGCPEETVCDILVPQIEMHFKRLRNDARHQGEFWALGEERRQIERETENQLERAERQELELLDSLQCSNSEDGLDGSEAFDRIVGLLGGFVGPERLTLLARTITREQRYLSHWKSRTHGVLLPEEREELRVRKEQFEAGLASRITPEELEELRVRLWALQHESEHASAFSQMTLTSGEYREFCRLLSQGEEGFIEEALRYGDLLDEPTAPVNRRQTEAAIRTLLGEERFAVFRQSSDRSFSAARELAEQAGQDPGVAIDAMAMVEAFRSEVPSLRALWSEDPASALRQLRERRDDLRRELGERLGSLPEGKREELVAGWIDEATREEWNLR